MKTIKILGFIILIAFGIFLVVFGEYDDSPGAQGLGLLVAIAAAWSIFKLLRKK